VPRRVLTMLSGRLPKRSPRLLVLLLTPALLLVVGTTGYLMIEEDYTFLDALYMTVITLSTIGYGETKPLSPPGRVFTIVLIFSGVFTLGYAITETIRAVVGGEIQDFLGRQRMERSLAELHDHIIVCGYGRMGKLVCREFSARGRSFVVVDERSELLAEFQVQHGLALQGDATSDEVLNRAGIARARALVSVLGSDADNLYITMSARLLNDRIFLVARAEDPASDQKLLRAGADRVVSPYQIGGARVAQAVLQPAVVDFIELATQTEHFALQIEEVRVAAGGALAGQTLKDSGVRQRFDVIIVAIKKAGGHMVFNPASDALLEADDTLIAIGDKKHLDQLEQLAGQPGA
jgi:voltage-gated potassium channel